MNMFKPVGATTAKEYIKKLEGERKKLILFLDTFIQRSAPNLKPYFAYNMLGYGKFTYQNYKKEILDWPIIALASQKNYVSLYVCSVDGNQYIAEKYKKELGKASVGKSCIRFKKIEDINLPTLKKVLIIASKHPGLQKSP